MSALGRKQTFCPISRQAISALAQRPIAGWRYGHIGGRAPDAPSQLRDIAGGIGYGSNVQYRPAPSTSGNRVPPPPPTWRTQPPLSAVYERGSTAIAPRMTAWPPQPGSIRARSPAHRPETRRNRGHFAAGREGISYPLVQDAARHHDGRAAPAARRRSRQPPHPGPGAGRQLHRRVEAVRPAERRRAAAMASSTSPTPNRTASHRTSAGCAASASASSRPRQLAKHLKQ